MPILRWTYAEYLGSTGLPPGDTVILADAQSVLEGLSPAALAGLAGAGVAALDSGTETLNLSVAQLQALGGMALTAADRVVLADTAVTLAALSPGQIAALVAAGIDAVVVTVGDLAWDAGQVAALGDVPLSIDHANRQAGSTVFDGVASGYRLEVTAAPASAVAALQADGAVDSIRLADSASAVAAVFASLGSAGKLAAIALTDSAALAMPYADFAAGAATLARLPASYTLSLAAVPPAAAAALQGNAHVVEFAVSGSAAQVAAALDSLAAAASSGKLAAIALTDAAPLAITAAQLAADGAALAKLPSEYTLRISGATASGAAALEANDHVIAYAVQDSIAHVTAALAALNGLAGLTEVTLSDGSLLTLDYAAWAGAAWVLGKLAGADIAVTGVAAAAAATVEASDLAASFTLRDSTANVVAALAGLNGLEKLTGIWLTDSVPIALSYSQYLAAGTALALLGGAPAITVAAVPAAAVAALQADAAITSFTVSDSTTAIAAALDALAGAGKLTGILLEDGSSLALTQAQYLADGAALALLPAGTTLQVGAATTAQLATLAGDARITGFAVLDSAANIAAAFEALKSAAKLTALAVLGGGPLTLTAAQYASPGTLFGKLPGDYTLTVAGLAAAAAEAAQAEAHVTGFTVRDSAANLAAALEQLAGYGKITAIALSSGSTLTIGYDQLADAAAALARLEGSIAIQVAGVTLAQAAATQADARVDGFTLADTAANLAAGFGTLAGATRLTAITVTDAAPVTLGYAAYAGNAAAVALLASSPGLTVTDATAAQAAAVQADAAVDAFTLSDTAAHVAAALDSLAMAGKLTEIHLLDSFVLPVTYAQYQARGATLALLQDGARLTVSGAAAAAVAAAESDAAVLGIAVLDSVANIAAAFASLNAAGKLTAIQLADNAELVLRQDQILDGERVLGLVGSAATLVVRADAATLGFTTAELGELADHGVQKLAAMGGSLALGIGQYLGLGPIGLRAGDSVTLADLGTHFAALTAAQVAGLAAAGVDRIDATDNRLRLTLEQLASLGSVALSGDDLLTLADSGASIAGLSSTEIAALASHGVTAIDAVDDALTLSYAQYQALDGIALATADHITLADTASNLANRNTQAMAGIDHILVYDSPGGQRLNGTLGNDTYYVDTAGDIITEPANGGIDTLVASTSFYLGANIENLILAIGAGRLFGMGNALANSLTGNEEANFLVAFAGNDTISGDDGSDSLFGLEGEDRLDGGAGTDLLTGGVGSDTLLGGAGSDMLHGEEGDDSLSGGPDFAADLLVGGAGNDTLDGASGLGEADELRGGMGDDLYRVDAPADRVIELAGEGSDTVIAAFDGAGYFLPASVEGLILQGSLGFAAGNALNNAITGSGGADWLLGGAGDDTLSGAAGDDRLLGETGRDVFVFAPGGGHDVILDFHQGQDRISLPGFDIGGHPSLHAAVQARSSAVGGNLLIEFGNGDSLLVLNLGQFASDDLI
ncbi:calcium-binding protein [Siccirubricoccus phaeus]|uniref:calcium-binding protein n=1 Tax=Siccirubricoccus phaeus TaxID=2595053 RepID=UPI0011F21396|nr:calcium-binding protein [Siccirubricoccus phaeus]